MDNEENITYRNKETLGSIFTLASAAGGVAIASADPNLTPDPSPKTALKNHYRTQWVIRTNY